MGRADERMTRDYELLVILHPELDAAALQAASEAIKGKLASLGEVTLADFWGQRRLAYTVRKCNLGFYLLLRFTASPAAVLEVRQFLRIEQHEAVIRYLLVVDEKRGGKPTAQPMPGAQAEQPAPVQAAPPDEDAMARAAAERAALEEAARAEAVTPEEPAEAAEAAGADQPAEVAEVEAGE
ncbi:MAG: 30S ribosomal protein S6 [Armatimonadetes bacterium]|nr:30S ribosomal protein S6 [Armatimonadota bacterium]